MEPTHNIIHVMLQSHVSWLCQIIIINFVLSTTVHRVYAQVINGVPVVTPEFPLSEISLWISKNIHCSIFRTVTKTPPWFSLLGEQGGYHKELPLIFIPTVRARLSSPARVASPVIIIMLRDLLPPHKNRTPEGYRGMQPIQMPWRMRFPTMPVWLALFFTLQGPSATLAPTRSIIHFVMLQCYVVDNPKSL